MNKFCLVFVFVTCAASFVPISAFADTPASPDGITYLPTITIVGRPNRPSVVIEVTRPTPTHEAAAAHDALRARLWGGVGSDEAELLVRPSSK